ncbi:hypothetical protein [Actinomadura rubrisoli]|uniref:DUF11 domain-containing protein n=1 Tax=Actinomadura rubrisoli TaxID=2530368 RepID=A0A4R4ZY66_9ACTN|nr:hypothetical protein [Actinomadura rubrisoli]TDD63580.1 hypothetical protein E1298_43625 [Actinomadura rubrisoli]
MVSRSAVKPICVGLGTAAVLAAASSSSTAGTTPTPSPPTNTSNPTDPVVTPALSVVVTAGGPTTAGRSIPFTTTVTTNAGVATDVHVTAVKVTASNKAVKPTVTEGCPPPARADACTLGKVTDKGKVLTSYVTVPKSLKKPITVTLKVTVKGTLEKKAQSDSDGASATFRPIVKPPPPKKPKPSKTPSPSPSKTAGGGGSGGNSGNNGTGGSGNTGTSGGGSSTGSGGTGSSGGVLPSPNSSFNNQNPQVALPPIAAPSPSVAPSPNAAAPESRLRGNQAPVAQDLTFERMASTQIAWLAALLVAFSLLLTQLRLGRRNSAAADAAARRARGTHRRSKRGMFAK